MKLRTNLAAIAAVCAALALPSAASAENATVLGFQVTSVSGGTATGILHCTTTTLAGQQASFPIGPYADASVLVPGAMVGIRVERSTIVGTSATPPCDSQLGTQPAPDDGRQAQDLPEPGEVLAAAELPGHFHVGRTVELAVVDVGAVLDRPLTARLEVGVPR